MLERIFKELRISLSLLLIFTLITGILYPALITFIAQSLFPWRANGSLVKLNDKVVGSQLIGQSFTESKYFWGRPSATTPFPYNAENSMGSNLGPLNTSYIDLVKSRKKILMEADSNNHQPLPSDLLTASASGLDPEISPQAAFYQASRVAAVRQIAEAKIQNLVRNNIQAADLGVLGEARVNVLALNLALDELDKTESTHGTKVIPVGKVEAVTPADKTNKASKPDKHKLKHIRHPDV